MEANGEQVKDEVDALLRMENLVGNAYSIRREMLDRLLNPNRDLFKECNYPDT